MCHFAICCLSVLRAEILETSGIVCIPTHPPTSCLALNGSFNPLSVKAVSMTTPLRVVVRIK